MEISDTRLWPNILLDGLNQNNVKLFGVTINYHFNMHIQSMVFCMDLNTLEFLINKEIFTMKKYLPTLGSVIARKELLMSKLILNNKWNIGCLHSYYHNVNFIKRPYGVNISYANPYFKNNFFGKTLHPYEILFVKGNKDIEPNIIKKFLIHN